MVNQLRQARTAPLLLQPLSVLFADKTKIYMCRQLNQYKWLLGVLMVRKKKLWTDKFENTIWQAYFCFGQGQFKSFRDKEGVWGRGKGFWKYLVRELHLLLCLLWHPQRLGFLRLQQTAIIISTFPSIRRLNQRTNY